MCRYFMLGLDHNYRQCTTLDSLSIEAWPFQITDEFRSLPGVFRSKVCYQYEYLCSRSSVSIAIIAGNYVAA